MPHIKGRLKTVLFNDFNRAVVVAVIAVLVVQTAVDDVVDVVARAVRLRGRNLRRDVAVAGVNRMAAVGLVSLTLRACSS